MSATNTTAMNIFLKIMTVPWRSGVGVHCQSFPPRHRAAPNLRHWNRLRTGEETSMDSMENLSTAAAVVHEVLITLVLRSRSYVELIIDQIIVQCNVSTINTNHAIFRIECGSSTVGDMWHAKSNHGRPRAYNSCISRDTFPTISGRTTSKPQSSCREKWQYSYHSRTEETRDVGHRSQYRQNSSTAVSSCSVASVLLSRCQNIFTNKYPKKCCFFLTYWRHSERVVHRLMGEVQKERVFIVRRLVLDHLKRYSIYNTDGKHSTWFDRLVEFSNKLIKKKSSPWSQGINRKGPPGRENTYDVRSILITRGNGNGTKNTRKKWHLQRN